MVAVVSPGWTAVLMLASLAGGLLPAASLLLTKRFVDTLTLVIATPAADRTFTVLAGLGALMALVMLAERLLSHLEQYALQAQTLTFSEHMGERLAGKALEVDLVRFEHPAFFDSMLMARTQATQRPLGMLRNTTVVARGAVSLIITLGVLTDTSLWLLPCVVLAAVPGLWVQFHTSRRLRSWQAAHIQEERRASYLENLTFSPLHAKEIRIFGFGDKLLDRWRGIRRALRKSQLQLTAHRAFRSVIAEALSAAVLAVAVVTIGVLALRGMRYSLGDLVMVYRAFTLGRSAFASLSRGVVSLHEDNVFLDSYHEYMAIPRTVADPDRPVTVPAAIRRGLAMEEVSFRYPGREQDALHRVTLAIPPGRHVALVGENGAGKTTLVKLLCRLYDPTSGRIDLEGVDLRHYRVNDVRAQFSILFQDFGRYDLTAAENMALEQLGAIPDDARLQRAVERARAAEIIAALPAGINTPLGRLFQGGVDLSAGQWQKIALARTFFRDAPFVILDEPSSALDPRAEYELFNRFHELMRDRTAIIISHRFSTVRMVDHIVVLKDGGIVQQGSHDDLMSRGGLYSEMFSLQAGQYT